MDLCQWRGGRETKGRTWPVLNIIFAAKAALKIQTEGLHNLPLKVSN